MPRILAVHASDAYPVLEPFHAQLDASSISFLNIEDIPSAERRDRLMEASRDIDICLVFSSDFLLQLLWPLASSGESQRIDYLLSNTRTFTIRLNLTRPSQGFSPVWRDLFHVTVVQRNRPLLQMGSKELKRYVTRLCALLEPSASFRDRFGGALHRNLWIEQGTNLGPGRPAIIDPRVVELLFATNRTPVKEIPTVKFPVREPAVNDFTGERADFLSFGACEVRIPEDHRIGHLELPRHASWIRFRFKDEAVDERRHFSIKAISPFDRNQFLEFVQGYRSRTALIFVHGFNTSFGDGVLRLSQIIWDMQFRGAPILFSWPSAGGVLIYLYDFNSALGARPWFGQLIQMLRIEAKIQTLHIIAHSMGNFVVLDALNALDDAGRLPELSEIVMAAPDIDVDLYKILAAKIRPRVRGMTLYASAKDKALVLSRSAAGKPRAGDVFNGGPILLPNIESIDVSAIGDEMLGLNHNVFADNRSLIDDIGRLVLSGDRPPDQRSPQLRCVPEGIVPTAYWRYVP